MNIRLALIYLLFFSVSYADDIYFKIGFAVRNIQVIDTTNGRINILRDGKYFAFDTAKVLKVVRLEVLSGQKSVYEMFSKELAEQHWGRKEQLEDSLKMVKIDSSRKTMLYLESISTWSNSVYVAGGGGIPQGARFELGYNVGVHLAIALSFGIGDGWSRDPQEGTIAFLGILRMPTQVLPVTPYLMLCRGGTIGIFGGSDNYTLIYFGAMIEWKSGIHFRPEVGMINTSKHISGGPGFFGQGTDPEIRESNLRIGLNLTLEIDFANL